MAVALWASVRDAVGRFGDRARTIAIGLVMGASALLAMTLSIHVAPGVIFDARAVPLAIAGLFGGPLAAAIAAAPALLCRVAIGGNGALAGSLDIAFVAGVAALEHWNLAGRPVGQRNVAVIAGATAVVDLLTYVALPPQLIVPTMLHIAGPATLFDVIGIGLAGLSLCGEERRHELVKANALYRAIIEALPDCLNVKDLDGRFIAANPATARLMSAYSSEHLIGKTDFDFYPEATARTFQEEERRVLAAGRETTIEQHAACADGRTVWLDTLKVPFRDPEGALVGLITHNRDVTATKLIELDLQKTRQQLAEALATMADGLVMYDREARIVLCNEQYRALFPLTADLRVTGASLVDILQQAVIRGEEELPPDVTVESWIAAILARHGSGGDRIIALADGRWIEARTRPMADGGCLTAFSDVTARQRQETALRHLAEHDPLTGLANRAAFSAALTQSHERASANKTEFAVLLVDLDRFKSVNDRFGHAVGDQFLIEVSHRLQAACRHGDVVARLGGDEFAIVSEGSSMETCAARIAQRILNGLAKPIEIDGTSLLPSGSVGYAVFPSDPSDPDVLVAHADQALYAAKGSGRRRWASYADLSRAPLAQAG